MSRYLSNAERIPLAPAVAWRKLTSPSGPSLLPLTEPARRRPWVVFTRSSAR